MAKPSSATIEHVHWRTRADWPVAHPRFAPGPRLQRLGYRSRDMKHPDGTWFNFEEADAFSKAVIAEAAEREAAHGRRARLPAVARKHPGRTLGELCDAVFDLPEFLGKPIQDGKRLRQPLSGKTVDGYRYCSRAAEAACTRLQARLGGQNSLWVAAASQIGTHHMRELLDEVERHSGLSAARAVRAFLRQMWNRLGRKEPGANRMLFADLERMPVPEGRLRPWEPEEFWHMVQVADALGYPGMADNFFWGALSGLRQTDRLVMRRTAISETHVTVMPNKTRNKTGVTVAVKYAGLLRQRQEAAWERRRSWPVDWPQVLVDEKNRKPWEAEGSLFRTVFTTVRSAAARSMPSCATLTDADLRDTHQSWLDRANEDPELIAIAAGHSPRRQLTPLQRKHYIAANQSRLDAAFDLLNAYLLKHQPAAAKENEG